LTHSSRCWRVSALTVVAEQQQQLVAAVAARPLVSRATPDRFVLDQRASATAMSSNMPVTDDLMLSLRNTLPPKKRTHFDQQQRAVAQKLQRTLHRTADKTPP
jgi:hypothetical protein